MGFAGRTDNPVQAKAEKQQPRPNLFGEVSAVVSILQGIYH